MHRRFKWFVVVLAVAALAGTSCRKKSSSRTPSPTVPPPAPGNIGAVAGDRQVTISWTASAGAVSYNLYWDTVPGVTLATGAKISGVPNPVVHSSLTNGVTYYYVVTAVNVAGESGLSSEASATPVAGPSVPNPPTGVLAVGGNTQVTITWSPVSGATSYNIYWDVTPGVTALAGSPEIGVTSPHVHTGRLNGVTYYHVVTALNPTGESPESAEVFATPSVGGVQTASVVLGGAGTVTFASVEHYYDPGWPGPGIFMSNSTPPGYFIDIFWDDPIADPGCPFDTCLDPLYIDVITPTNDYWEVPCVYDVTLCVTQYATSLGGQTIGTFSGVVEDVFAIATLTLQSGTFTAERSY